MSALTVMYVRNGCDLLLTDADWAAFNATAKTRQTTTVTDNYSGKRFVVRHADCGLPGCLCAAEIVAEEPGEAVN